MLTNVLQKPVGALAVLTAAIGGPYAAFETDAGSMVRRVISGGMQQTTMRRTITFPMGQVITLPHPRTVMETQDTTYQPSPM